MTEPNPVAELQWQDLAVGMEYHFETLLTPGLLDQYASFSGDINPLHMSQTEAARRGFPKRVAHGMLLGGLLSRLVGCHLPGRFALLLSANFKFRHPCLEGDLVHLNGVLQSLSPSTRTLVLGVKFLIKDKIHAEATATVSVQS